MYKKQGSYGTTSIKINQSIEGETIEQKVERIVNNKEPISDGAPIIFQERKDGVQPAYDIRTDRFEVAIDAMNAVSKTHTAKREERLEERKKAVKDLNRDGKAETIQGQGNNPEGGQTT